MREAEARRLPYLFKLRLTKNVKRMIEKLASAREWVDAGQGFEAKESTVRLEGWSRQRRVIVLRRRLKDAVGLRLSDDDDGPLQLAFVEIGEATDVYEYSVLVTSLDETTEAFGQLYRDRGDEENILDEMKNQWGWGGYTTHDLARCRLAARLLALFYDWWIRLVEHLRSPRRSRLASRSDHQPAAVSLGDRDPHPARAANNDPRDEFARQSRTRRPGARSRRRVPARPGQKCGAVNPPRHLAGDLIAGFPGAPQRPPPPPPAPPRTELMQPKREKSQTAKASDPPTAVFRFIGISDNLHNRRRTRRALSNRNQTRQLARTVTAQKPFRSPFNRCRCSSGRAKSSGSFAASRAKQNAPYFCNMGRLNAPRVVAFIKTLERLGTKGADRCSV